jgi:cell division protein FtsQ
MSRSLAAAPAHRRIGARARDRSAAGAPGLLSAVLRALTGAARPVRAGADFVLRRRRLRIALLCVTIVMALLGCGWLWLRSSPFVAVQKVRITGVHGPDAQAVQAALALAARGMSTLDVNTAELSAAVASLRVVRAVRVVPRFPHGLRIEVSEQLPVAALTVAGVRTAVAADGVVLGPSLVSGSLPSVIGSTVPAPGKSVRGAELLAALSVLGAAPAQLAKHVERVFAGPKGLTVAMRNGLLVYFGDASRPHAKWLSLARVLADPSSVGSSYVDVRLPSYPAAGFPPGVTPPDPNAAASVASGEAPTSPESAVASLAAGLSSGTAATSASGADAAGASTAGGAEGSEASSAEASAEGEGEGAPTGTESGTEAGR